MLHQIFQVLGRHTLPAHNVGGNLHASVHDPKRFALSIGGVVGVLQLPREIRIVCHLLLLKGSLLFLLLILPVTQRFHPVQRRSGQLQTVAACRSGLRL
ncbi:hypothetical protein SDC9_119189 [bioreactor metagenome]|uniref:Uncharacterized protein n=1 Tax=bioreactor metagenome TaxID=1076179 RepID=A0A645C323_9ZZZZ